MGLGGIPNDLEGLFHLDLPTLPVRSENEERVIVRNQAASFLEEE
jgi:hypothetical protein